MVEAVHSWMAAYAAHLEAGQAALQECAIPDADWQQRCQDFDGQLRAFSSDAIGRAANVAPGHDLLARLRTARTRLDEAFAAHRSQLQEQLVATARGRKGLRGYDDAGRRMTTGSALYLERRY